MRFNLPLFWSRHSKFLVAAAICVGMSSTLSISARAQESQDAVTAMGSDPQLTDWLYLVQTAGLGGAASTAQYTVFALTNDGFDRLNALWKGMLRPQGTNKPVDPQVLQRVLRSQAVLGLHPPSEFAGKVVTLTSVNGTKITVDGTVPNALKMTMAYATGHQVAQPTVATNAIIYPVIVDNVHR